LNKPVRDLIIILDSVRYDRFIEASTPNMKRFKFYEAWSHGTWSRPSTVSIFSGFLPQSDAGQPYEPSSVMLGPQMFAYEGEDGKKVWRDVPTWYLNANPWTQGIGPAGYAETYYKELYSGPEQVKDAARIMRTSSEFLVAIHIMETHAPYYLDPSEDLTPVKSIFRPYNREGADNGAPDLAAERSRESIARVDRMIAPLLPLVDRVVITADHGDLQGEHGKIGHFPTFPFHPALIMVPLVMGGFE